MGFTDELNFAALDMMKLCGFDAVLSRYAGGEVACHIDITRDEEFQPERFETFISGRQTIIDFCLSEIVTPSIRGDTITISTGIFAGVYIVDSEFQNDGYFQRVIVNKT